MKRCSKCFLTNPDSALRCDCGYDFVSRTVESSYLPVVERRLVKSVQGMLWLWLRIFLIGIAAALLSLLFLHFVPRGWWSLVAFLVWPTVALFPIDAAPSSMMEALVVIGILALINGIIYVSFGTVIFLLRGGIVRFKSSVQ